MVAPLLADALYAGVTHATPYWLGLAMMVTAAVVIARARFASPSQQAAGAAADHGAAVEVAA
jgi:DHA1 family tetracycline resistance protein-like MFS transporter